LGENSLEPEKFATGDYYCQFTAGGKTIRLPIIANSSDTIKVSENISDMSANNLQIVLRCKDLMLIRNSVSDADIVSTNVRSAAKAR
jgi:hypothetical protein